jgi:hypothetical protein
MKTFRASAALFALGIFGLGAVNCGTSSDDGGGNGGDGGGGTGENQAGSGGESEGGAGGEDASGGSGTGGRGGSGTGGSGTGGSGTGGTGTGGKGGSGTGGSGTGGMGTGGMGTGGSGTGGAAATPKFATDIAPIFKAACGNAMCHGGQYGMSNMVIYTRLMGMAGGACEGRPRMMAGNSAMSLVVQKMAGTQNCGMRMPDSNRTYFDTKMADLDKIKAWIDGGAKND